MKYSQIFLVVLALAWICLPLTAVQKIILLGFITIYLGLHNLVGYKLANNGKTTIKKLNSFRFTTFFYWAVYFYNRNNAAY